jgi:hypothetical protein
VFYTRRIEIYEIMRTEKTYYIHYATQYDAQVPYLQKLEVLLEDWNNSQIVEIQSYIFTVSIKLRTSDVRNQIVAFRSLFFSEC